MTSCGNSQSLICWPGQSCLFDGPDQNLVEMATPWIIPITEQPAWDKELSASGMLGKWYWPAIRLAGRPGGGGRAMILGLELLGLRRLLLLLLVTPYRAFTNTPPLSFVPRSSFFDVSC